LGAFKHATFNDQKFNEKDLGCKSIREAPEGSKWYKNMESKGGMREIKNFR
jgi:hypothetical protein